MVSGSGMISDEHLFYQTENSFKNRKFFHAERNKINDKTIIFVIEVIEYVN